MPKGFLVQYKPYLFLFISIFQLLSAIQSIDEVLNPSSRASSSRGSGESRRGMPRRWGDNAPWRRKGKTSAERHPVTRLPQTEGTLLPSCCIQHSISKTSLGNAEYNFHDSLQARFVGGIGHLKQHVFGWGSGGRGNFQRLVKGKCSQ